MLLHHTIHFTTLILCDIIIFIITFLTQNSTFAYENEQKITLNYMPIYLYVIDVEHPACQSSVWHGYQSALNRKWSRNVSHRPVSSGWYMCRYQHESIWVTSYDIRISAEIMILSLSIFKYIFKVVLSIML